MQFAAAVARKAGDAARAEQEAKILGAQNLEGFKKLMKARYKTFVPGGWGGEGGNTAPRALSTFQNAVNRAPSTLRPANSILPRVSLMGK